jgi:hypothetical protein
MGNLGFIDKKNRNNNLKENWFSVSSFFTPTSATPIKGEEFVFPSPGGRE